MIKITIASAGTSGITAWLTAEADKPDFSFLNPDDAAKKHLQKEKEKKKSLLRLAKGNQENIIQFVDTKKAKHLQLEAARRAGYALWNELKSDKQTSVILSSSLADKDILMAYTEGLALSNYQFLKYKKDKDAYQLKQIVIADKKISKDDAAGLQIIAEAVALTKDLVNEPVSYLTAEQLSKEIERLGKQAGFKTEIFNKAKIKALKMGGLLGVNKGSQDPPTFNILEYKPAKHKNKKAIVLVGKGVVYDTGGLSLKPTPGGMDTMKCDMAGGAVVTGVLYAIAKQKLPLHVVGLIPATDNRPGENAITPGDVLTISDGTTIEVLNTDAEGRLILADALHYAKKYKPELVLDFATLTGAAARAIGEKGIVYMGTADEAVKTQMTESGNTVYERLVEFPLWDEYGDMLKSDLADMKNIGGGVMAGAITAGKFLEHFTDYPWLHFDIAGPAFIGGTDSYRGKNATAIGVRLVLDFLKKQMK